MRSGSAAIAKNGKIDVMPITWKRACARDSEKTAASFALPYGRARKRTRRIKSATLWINEGKAAPSYTFKRNGPLHRAAMRICQLSAEKPRVSKLPDVGLSFIPPDLLRSRYAKSYQTRNGEGTSGLSR